MKDTHTQNNLGTEDAMDWYRGGASKAPGNSGSHGMEPKPAAGMPLVLQKINLVTSLAALIMQSMGTSPRTGTLFDQMRTTADVQYLTGFPQQSP